MRLALVLLAAGLLAAGQPRSRKAHVHGSAKVDLAFETTTGAPRGVAEFEAPADSVVGFEHAARTAADKAKAAAALGVLKARFGEMVVFPPAAGCKVSNKSAELAAEGDQHMEVRAAFDVQCARPLAGGEVRFGFTKVFPRIQAVDVTLLAGDQQLSVNVANDKGGLQIAR